MEIVQKHCKRILIRDCREGRQCGPHETDLALVKSISIWNWNVEHTVKVLKRNRVHNSDCAFITIVSWSKLVREEEVAEYDELRDNSRMDPSIGCDSGTKSEWAAALTSAAGHELCGAVQPGQRTAVCISGAPHSRD